MWRNIRRPCDQRTCSLVPPDVQISRIRRSRILSTSGVRRELQVSGSQLYQTQAVKVLVISHPFRFPEGPLAPPTQLAIQSALYEIVNLSERPSWIAKAEVFRPAVQVTVEPLNHFGQRHATRAPADNPPQGLAFTCQRPRRWGNMQVTTTAAIQVAMIPERKPQEVELAIFQAEVHHLGFVPIDDQSHPAFERRSDPLLELGSLIPGHDDEIVRITDQTSFRPMGRAIRIVEPLIEPVQKDVGQQRRDHAALRGAAPIARPLRPTVF